MNRSQLRGFLATSALVLSAVGAATFAMSSASSPGAGVTPPDLAPAEANWIRYGSQSELLAASERVTRGTITGISGLPPLDAASVGAASGAPSIPRRLVTVSGSGTSRSGMTGAQKTSFVEHLAPDGAYFPEVAPLRVGQKIVVFTRQADSALPTDNFEANDVQFLVGLDGLYLEDRGGSLKSPLEPTYTDSVANLVRAPQSLQRELTSIARTDKLSPSDATTEVE